MVMEEREAHPRGAVAGLTVASVFEAHGAFVWRSLRSLGVREQDADDVTQEVFVVVHRKLQEFEGRGTIRSWLYSICVRAAHGWRRRAPMRLEVPTEELPEPAPVPGAAGVDDDVGAVRLRDRLHQALAALEPGKREVFVLYELESMSMAEIAQALGVPLQTAYSRLHAARKALYQVYEGAESP